MFSESGGFYSAQDADSEGVEESFSPGQLMKLILF